MSVEEEIRAAQTAALDALETFTNGRCGVEELYTAQRNLDAARSSLPTPFGIKLAAMDVHDRNRVAMQLDRVGLTMAGAFWLRWAAKHPGENLLERADELEARR